MEFILLWMYKWQVVHRQSTLGHACLVCLVISKNFPANILKQREFSHRIESLGYCSESWEIWHIRKHCWRLPALPWAGPPQLAQPLPLIQCVHVPTLPGCLVLLLTSLSLKAFKCVTLMPDLLSPLEPSSMLWIPFFFFLKQLFIFPRVSYCLAFSSFAP